MIFLSHSKCYDHLLPFNNAVYVLIINALYVLLTNCLVVLVISVTEISVNIFKNYCEHNPPHPTSQPIYIYYPISPHILFCQAGFPGLLKW